MKEPRSNPRSFWRMSVRSLVLLVLVTSVLMLALRGYYGHTPAGRWEGSLRSDDARLRLAAAALLQSAEPIDPETLYAGLIETLRDPDPAVRAQAARSLPVPILETSRQGRTDAASTQIERAWRALSGLLDDLDPFVRAAAVKSLATLAAHASREDEITPELLNALGDPDAYVRMAAAVALRDLQLTTSEARSAWMTALNDRNTGIREIALIALGTSFGHDEEVVREIIARFEDSDSGSRNAAGNALWMIPRPPPGVAPDLVAALGRRPARLAALPEPEANERPLNYLGQDLQEMAVRSVSGFFPGEDQITHYIGGALSRIGPSARDQVPALGALLDEARSRSDGPAIVAIAEAIGGIAPESPEGARAVDALAELLRSDEPSVDLYYPAIYLGLFGRYGAPALPALREAAAYPKPGSQGHNARETIARIEAALEADAEGR